MDTETIEAAGLEGVTAQLGPMGAQGGWPMIQDTWLGEAMYVFMSPTDLYVLYSFISAFIPPLPLDN